jgi:acyl-coenzyme A thioesterase PaaI-like protein
MITAILDETIGRAIMIKSKDIWGVTIEFNTRFRKPVPLDKEIRVIGRIVKETHRSFEGTGEILLRDGSVAAEGSGKYLKLPIEKITDFDYDIRDWKVVPSDDDPEQVEI